MSFCPWKHMILRTLYILPPSEDKETSIRKFSHVFKGNNVIVASGTRTTAVQPILAYVAHNK